MRTFNWDRIAAASGIPFVILFVVAFIIPGELPDPGDSRAAWVTYTLDHTKELKVSAIVFGLAFIAFLWFLGSLVTTLRSGGEPRLAAVTLAAGTATVAVALVSTAFQAMMAWRLASDEPALTRAFADMQFVFGALVSFAVGAAIFAAAIASWRARIFPAWYGAASVVVALAVVFAGGALAHDGFYAPNGGYPLIATAASLIWVLVTSVFLMKRASATTAAVAGG